jgi:hypothetical protein
MMDRPLTLPRQESEDVAALQFTHDLNRHLIGFGRADDSGEAGHPAVYQLDTPGPQLNIVDGAVQVAFHARHLNHCPRYHYQGW